VLARQVKVTVQGQLHALQLLDVLKQRDACSYQIALVLPQGSAFVASTPERLYARQGRDVVSEAVAGVLPLCLSPSLSVNVFVHPFVRPSICLSVSTRMPAMTVAL
jgi:isochorismate synthase EntC